MIRRFQLIVIAAILLIAAFSTSLEFLFYLVYLAITMWRDSSVLRVEAHATPMSSRRVIASAILVNLLNPKLTLFFFAFLPQFVGAEDAPRQMLELSAVFMLVTLAVFVVYGALAAAVRDRVLTQPRVLLVIRRTFAVAFVGLAARLATAER